MKAPDRPAAHKSWFRRASSIGLVLIAAALAFLAFLIWNGSRLLDAPLAALAGDRMVPAHDELFEADALRVFVCGSSSPLATPDRAKTCIGVIANGRILLFDTGAGSMRNIENWRLKPERISHVFLTHFHSDHFADLDEVAVQSWIMGRREPITVFGGEGVERVVEGYNQALALDAGYRNAYGTERFFPIAAATLRPHPISPLPGRAVPVFREGKLVVSAFAVDHGIVKPALGYEVRYGDRRIVISGDTRRNRGLETFAEQADVLFHEAYSGRLTEIIGKGARQSGNARMQYILGKAGDYHTPSEDFSELAGSTRARRVVMYHLAPPPDNFVMKRIFLSDMPDNVTLAEDGQLFTLRPGETGIDESWIAAP